MHPFVLPALLKFTGVEEGAIRWMYLDNPIDKSGKLVGPRLVTVGIGFMIEPILSYVDQYTGAFTDKDSGHVVGRQAIIDEFNSVKTRTDLVGWPKFEKVTQLRLNQSFIEDKAKRLLLEKEGALKTDPRVSNYFGNFENFPLDAQLACVSRAYGRIEMPSSSTKAQAYYDAILAEDWFKAADNCAVIGWYVPKNQAHETMFCNAAICAKNNYPKDKLVWPGQFVGTG
jgi:hypothetical protein